MKIKINSQIYIYNPTKEITQWIKSNLSIPNPEIQKKQAMGFWAGNIVKTINMYAKIENGFIIPIGEIDNIWHLHPYKQDYIIDFGKHEKIKFPENTLKLYDYQEKAVTEMLKVKRGILESKCRIW